MYSESFTSSNVAVAFLQHSMMDIALKICCRSACSRSAIADKLC